jgi:hypothetical protein
MGLTVDPHDGLLEELRDRLKDTEGRERSAWRERDVYREALNSANLRLAVAGLEPVIPELSRPRSAKLPVERT